MLRHTMAAILCVVLLSAPARSEPTAVTLRLRREVGQTLKYRAAVSGAGAITILGDRQPVRVRGRFTRTERTLAPAAPGGWQVEVKIENSTLALESGADQQTITLQAPTLTEIVDERGAVSEVRGWDTTPAATAAPGMGEAVRPLFGLTQVEGLPAGPVKPGDSWTAKAKLRTPDGADQELEQRFEFVRVTTVAGAPCAEIRSTAELPIKRRLPPAPTGMQVSVEGTQRLETASWIALAPGVLVRQQTTISLDLKTSTLLGGAAPDAVVPGATNLRVKVTLDLEP